MYLSLEQFVVLSSLIEEDINAYSIVTYSLKMGVFVDPFKINDIINELKAASFIQNKDGTDKSNDSRIVLTLTNIGVDALQSDMSKLNIIVKRLRKQVRKCENLENG